MLYEVITLDTALEMQESVKKFKKINTIAGVCSVSMKIGLAHGESLVGKLGSDIKQYFFAGDTLDEACECEHHAGTGDIIVTKDMRVNGAKYRFQETNGYLRLLNREKAADEPAVKQKYVKPEPDRVWFGDFIDEERNNFV